MRGKRISVFISVGRHFRPDQQAAFEKITEALRTAGLHPLLVERNKSYVENPMGSIQNLLSRCKGMIIIAFARYHFPNGLEWPDSSAQRETGDRRLTSVWLQIEAAMAYQAGIPTLMFLEEHLHPEGLLNLRHMKSSALSFRPDMCQERLQDEVLAAIREFAETLQHNGNRI